MPILAIPYFQQETLDTCAAACLRMAIAFRFPDESVWEAEWALKCRCLDGQGIAPDDAFVAAQSFGLPVRWLDNSNIGQDIETALESGSPVVANVELQALRYLLQDVDSNEEFWHSVLIIGMDDQFLYLHDPDQAGGGPRLEIERHPFIAEWHRHGHSAFRV